MAKQNIAYGNGSHDSKGDPVDLNVTRLEVYNATAMVSIIIERGGDVRVICLSIEKAEEIGFLNFSALNELHPKL